MLIPPFHSPSADSGGAWLRNFPPSGAVHRRPGRAGEDRAWRVSIVMGYPKLAGWFIFMENSIVK